VAILSRELDCPICGTSFTCKRWFGCWCASVKVTREKREQLELWADDCVCVSCLTGPVGKGPDDLTRT
jgi:hypothetical protein